MEIPLVGKVRRPGLWVAGGVTAIAVTLGAITFAVRSREAGYDLAALTVAAETTALTVRITASGTVEPVQTVNLSPKTSGILEELLVEQGDAVTAGQLMAQMESQDVAALVRQREAAVAEAQASLADVQRGSEAEAIAQATAQVASAEAQVRDLRAQLELARSQLQRNQALAAQGAISANELDNFEQAVQSAEAGVERAQFQVRESEERLADLQNEPRPEAIAQAEARLAQAQAQLEAAQVQFADTQIRAPFAGIVTQKFANEGAFVTPTTSASNATSATSTAIVAIASDLEIVAEVPEADIAKIRPGQPVEIIADAYPDQVFEGAVRLIAPEAIERQNVTLFQVRIELTSGQDLLRSNMNVTVAFIGDALADALVVPTVAVVTQEGQAGVLVPDDRDRPRFRPVTLGTQAGNQIQIIEGIGEGDLVFVDLPPGETLENLTFGRDAAPEEER
ncbi:efflux RND transporter periplasmic adaptor subunit [Halomicronema sp. CCY15110]|uniref:efflux RND transporter periplasmic adaptor subunit n=1 Tax=Halomicronema sp. CCY15110 TaxID=2767773 RepID=UPI001950AB41|nr:efflux RND transporter periplasmic adaptor subunit [Halomicronema sp. CCY15110]